MTISLAYCATCERNVRISWSTPPSHEGQANLADPEVVCLDMHEHCAGDVCALSNMPRFVMAVRLARSNLDAVHTPLIRHECVQCGNVADMRFVDETQSVCADCDAINLWGWRARSAPQ